MESLKALIDDKYTTVDELADLLDAMSHTERMDAIRPLSRAHLSRLYSIARGGGALGVDDFVPESTPALTEVVHWGKNSLPAFNFFQKRFCRPDAEQRQDETELLWGYNEQEMRFATGPGYFVVRDGDADDPIVIDYRAVPPAKPYGWPEILPNSARLGRFVYNGTVDKMRRVSKHVTIGAAYRDEQPIGAWFILVREDRPKG